MKTGLLAVMAVGILLSGCATAPSAYVAQPKEPDLTKYSAAQLCSESDAIQPSLSVNPSSHPEYNDNLRRSKALDKEISARGLNCYKLKEASAGTVALLSPGQAQARVSAVCSSKAQRAQFADSSVLLDMCKRGYLATSAKCSADTARFTSEAQKLTGAARAEYVEIGNAFRTGCNLNAE
ncbi:TPA: hypothetical protein ACIAHZ_004017 [Enterobacter roggenkampii]|uniref:hypothetical protein n=1 Tax=Enterobacter roggenkampii TaxID=1812935 RepID=UPI003785EEE6